jgi:CHAT domain-containing protein
MIEYLLKIRLIQRISNAQSNLCFKLKKTIWSSQMTLIQKNYSNFIRLALNLSFAVICLSAHLAETSASATTQFPISASALKVENSLSPGLNALQRGDFEAAIIYFSNALKQHKVTGAIKPQFTTLIHLSNAYQAIGESAIAITYLHSALKLTGIADNHYKASLVMSHLGNAYLRSGDDTKATLYLTKAIKHARHIADPTLEATAFNNAGIVQMSAGDLPKARSHFQQSARLAASVNNNQLAGKSFSNLAKLMLLGETKSDAGKYIHTALEYVAKTTDSHDKALQLLRIGRLAQTLSGLLTNESPQWRTLSYQCFKNAAKVAKHINDQRSLSYSQGYLGQLYMAENLLPEALQLTRLAVNTIKQLRAPDILYQWQWQKGRILKQQHQSEEAISAYQQAIATLQNIRQSINTGMHPEKQFQRKIGSVYLELADLLLHSSDMLNDKAKIQSLYLAARDTIEQLKTAELEDYLQDDCVARLQAKVTPLDTISARTAVIYPILLADRIEILVSLRGGIKRYTIPVNKEKLTHEVRRFRTSLENRTTREYLPHAQTLYRWLINPMLDTLTEKEITTLVIVPDGPLLTIPLAALHDGHHFLIEEYAVAITPSMNLTDPKPLPDKTIKVLAIGLTESVQGYPALPSVESEIEGISNINKTKVLMDRNFSHQKLQKVFSLSAYTIVHFATHGQFDSDPRKSFILSFDKPILADELKRLIEPSRFRDKPVELLTLSACQTAAGDERAALGLAGIAIKAGARSALATLWLINDQATSDLVVDFYSQLKLSSKAQALQHAQTHLIQETAYQHPYFWSPFLLIGNWL